MIKWWLPKLWRFIKAPQFFLCARAKVRLAVNWRQSRKRSHLQRTDLGQSVCTSVTLLEASLLHSFDEWKSRVDRLWWTMSKVQSTDSTVCGCSCWCFSTSDTCKLAVLYIIIICGPPIEDQSSEDDQDMQRMDIWADASKGQADRDTGRLRHCVHRQTNRIEEQANSHTQTLIGWPSIMG